MSNPVDAVRRGGLWADPSRMESAREGLAQGWAASVVDPVAAAIQAALPGSPMWSKNGSFRKAYQQNLARQQAHTRQIQQAHPNIYNATQVAGALLSPINKIAAPAKGAGLVSTALRSSIPASIYGLIHGASTAPAGSTALDVAKKAGTEGLESGLTAPVMTAPLHAAGTLASKVYRAAAPKVVNAAGEFTAFFKNMVREAFPNGEVHPGDINPAVAQAQVDRAGQITPQVVRQVVAKQHGADLTASMSAGKAAPKLLEKAAPLAERAQQGKAAVAASLHQATGAQAPDPTSLATAVGEGYISARKAVDKAYDTLAQNDTVLGPSFAEGLPNQIVANLKNDKRLPNVSDIGDALRNDDLKQFRRLMIGSGRGPLRTPSLLEQFGELAPQEGQQFTRKNGDWFGPNGAKLSDNEASALEERAQAALFTDRGAGMPEDITYTPKPATLEQTDALRKRILNAYNKADNDQDRAALEALRGAVDSGIEDTVKGGDYTGEGGEQVLEQLANARQAHAFMAKNYADPKSAHPTIRNTINALGIKNVDGEYKPTANPGVIEGLGAKLGETLLDPNSIQITPKGKDLMHSIAGLNLAPDTQDVFHQYIRSTVGRPATGDFGAITDLGNRPADITRFLNDVSEPGSPYANVLSPEQASALRTGAATHNMLSGALPSGEVAAPATDDSVKSLHAKQLLADAAMTAATAAGHHLTGIPLTLSGAPGELVGGYLLGRNINSRIATGETNRLLAQELAGAPAFKPDLSGVGAIGSGMASAATSVRNPQEAPLPPPAAPPPKALSMEQALAGLPEEAPASSVQQLVDPGQQFTGKAISLDAALAGLPDDGADQRVHRASGGKVNDIEHLVGKLMRGAKHAKRHINNHTETLLKHDDSTIVSALNTAKKAI